MSQFSFKRAERKAIPIKAAIAGPSGSGKTEGMLRMLRELVGPQGKVAVIDTENGSASLYSDRHDFDTVILEAPYTSDRYIDAIQAAVTRDMMPSASTLSHTSGTVKAAFYVARKRKTRAAVTSGRTGPTSQRNRSVSVQRFCHVRFILSLRFAARSSTSRRTTATAKRASRRLA